MWNRVVVGCALVLSIGCEQGRPKPDCAGAAASIAHAAVADGNKAQPSNEPLVARCRDDKWSAEAATCIKEAATLDAQQKCRFDHLTQAQDAKFVDAAGAFFGGDGKEAMKAMHMFADKMCGCKTADCAKSVSDEMTAWSQAQAGKASKPPKLSEAQIKEATELGTRMGECMQKAMGM